MGALQSLQTFSSVMETNREYHAIGQEDIKCLPAFVKIILVMTGLSQRLVEENNKVTS
jgi:hypothetical protein